MTITIKRHTKCFTHTHNCRWDPYGPKLKGTVATRDMRQAQKQCKANCSSNTVKPRYGKYSYNELPVATKLANNGLVIITGPTKYVYNKFSDVPSIFFDVRCDFVFTKTDCVATLRLP